MEIKRKRRRPTSMKDVVPCQFWSKAGIKCKAGEKVVMSGID